MLSSDASGPAIPDYILLRQIGRGSYGDVWLARSVTGAFRAIKFVWRDRFEDVRPYEREFEGITRFTQVSLREPSQLALLHVGRDDNAGFFYYVMELADDAARGRDIDAPSYRPLTLKSLREHQKRIPPAEVVALGVSLARGLCSLHAAGLVHRDIKPSNIVLIGGVPKLADVGLVAAASADLTFVGTEGFVPPEGPGAPSADIFSLGKVLYEMATGLDRDDFPRLPPNLGDWPDRKELLELNEVLLRACEPDVKKRFADARVLLDELLLLQAGKSVRRLRNAERRMARALRVAVILALIAAVAGTGAWFERQRANDELALRQNAEAERDALHRRAMYASTLSQVQHAINDQDYGQARALLQAAAPQPGERDLRGFEWHALTYDAEGDAARVLRSHGSPGQTIRYSAAAGLVALHTKDLEVTLWATDSGREKLRLKSVDELAAFSDDGQWLYGTMFGPRGERLHRWSVPSGELDPKVSFGASHVVGQSGADQWITFNKLGGGQPDYLRAVDFKTGKEIWHAAIPGTGPGSDSEYATSALSPDGRACALALIHGRSRNAQWQIMVLALPNLEVLHDETIAHRPVLAFGRNADELLCGQTDTGEISLRDLPRRRLVWRSTLPMTDLAAITHDRERTIAVGGGAGNVVLLDASNGTISGLKRGHESNVQDIAFIPQTADLVSTGNGGDVRLWPLQRDSSRQTPGFLVSSGGGRALCLSPDGRSAAGTDEADQIRIIETLTGKEIARLAQATRPLAFFPDGRGLWVIGTRNSIEAWRLGERPELIDEIPLPIKPFMAAASPDQRVMTVLDEKGAMLHLEVSPRRIGTAISSGHRYPYWVTISPDGRLAATSGTDFTVRIWNVATGASLAHWPFTDSIANAAFLPNGRSIALVHKAGTLEVRDLTGHNAPVQFATSSGVLEALTVHPTEPRLFLGGRAGVIHIIDTNRWEEIAQLRAAVDGRAGKISRAAFSADGSTLAAYTETGIIRFWRKSPIR